jgi:hypothetical protein
MITDTEEVALVYWPLTMVGGQTSEVLEFIIDNPSGPTARMSATKYDNLKTWARKVGDADYIDISASPYDLSVVAAGPANMEMFIEALSDIDSFERNPVSVVVGSSSAAGWEM